ncbi:MAG TPA: peroxidase-related enzyme [Candidatus Thermoplasmatota archaeon]|nr:peroxidase-related enzyme [Candidatus Thermoplasmatota archaeon]
MTYIRVVDEAEATGRLREVYEAVRAARGSVGNIMKAESLQPEALQKHLDLYAELLYGKGGLSRREREMVAVVVSAANKCAYSIVHHADALGRYVTEPGLVPLLVADASKAPLDQRERAIVNAAVRLTKHAEEWTKGDVDTLHLAGMQDDDVLGLVQLVAYFNFANRLAIGTGATPEDADKRYLY